VSYSSKIASPEFINCLASSNLLPRGTDSPVFKETITSFGFPGMLFSFLIFPAVAT